MLDWLGPDYITRDELSLRGYDVPCYPSSQGHEQKASLFEDLPYLSIVLIFVF